MAKRVYGKEINDFVEALKANGWEGDETHLREVVATHLHPPVLVNGVEILGTVPLASGPVTPLDFKRALEKAGWSIHSRAFDVINVPFSQVSPVEVEIGAVSVAALGFDHSVSRKKAYEKIQGLEWELCTPEAVVMFCVHLKHKVKEEQWFPVAMDPVRNTILDIGHRVGDVYVIDGDHVNRDRHVHPGDMLLVMRSKK